MPSIIRAPERVLRKSKEAKVKKDTRLFYEKEIERNRKNPLPEGVSVDGYSRKAEIPVPSGGSRHSSSTGNWRTRDEWVYGVTIYLP
jgi:hypothetical protein